jgi:predicted nuclease of predicted toxin-antitoxin system
LRFLLDMGISARVTTWLKENGYDAIHLTDEALHTLSDIAIIEKAIQEDRIILTADMDFGHLLATNKSYIVSVIQFRVTNFKADNIIDKLTLVFEKITIDLETQFLITVEDNRIRYRTLPI